MEIILNLSMSYLLMVLQHPTSHTGVPWMLSVGGAWIDSNESSYDRRSRRLSSRLDQNCTAQRGLPPHTQWISQSLGKAPKQCNMSLFQYMLRCFLPLRGVRVRTKLTDEAQFFVAVSCRFPLEARVSQRVSASCSGRRAAHPV